MTWSAGLGRIERELYICLLKVGSKVHPKSNRHARSKPISLCTEKKWEASTVLRRNLLDFK